MEKQKAENGYVRSEKGELGMKKKSLEHLLQWSLILMLICLPNEPFLIAFAETGESELVQTLEESSLLEEIDTRSLLPQATFEFKQPRFSGTLGNPLLLELVSDLAVEEVVLELPPELEVLTEEQPSEKTVIKKDTNHWQIKTSQRQQSFAVPIIAKQTGCFVVTSGGAEALVEIKAANDSKEDTQEDTQKEVVETGTLASQGTDTGVSEQSGSSIESPQDFLEEAASDARSSSFDGSVVEVASMAEFMSALQNPTVSIISLQADLTQSANNVMDINRSIMIQGNGHTLTFNNNNAYFRLTTVNEETTFRLENLSYHKTGNTALIQTTNILSRDWVVEVANVEEVATNRSPFILAREAKVHFTGGINRFEAMTMDSDTLFNLKEVEASNQAQVIINKPNMWIFYTAPDISDPRLLIDEGAQVTIVTQQGAANTIDLRGDNGKVILDHNAQLDIQSPGAATNATNEANNALILSGKNPTFIAAENAVFSINVTERKRGLALTGDQPELSIQSRADVSIKTVNANAILLNGGTPSMTITGDRTFLRVTNEFAAEANAIDIRGDNGAFSISEEGSLFIQSQGATIEASNNQNNAIMMSGANPKMIVSEAAFVQIEATQRRRGLFLTGDNPHLVIQSGSKANLTAGNANALRVDGKNADVTITGQDTHVSISSKITAAEGAASFVLTTPANASESGVLMVSDSAVLEVDSIDSSAINVTSLGFTFEVQSNGKLITSSQYANGDHATIRFLYYGLVTFHVTDGGTVNVFKTGGSAPLIRIPSGGNSFEISDGGIVDLYNPGTGTPSDGNVAGGNQGIFYARGIYENGSENNFSIVGVNSKFMCVAKSGPGIDMHTYFNSTIYVEQGYFQVEGHTSTPNGGVFRSGNLSVILNDPVFFDFRNERFDGGNIFSVSNLSTLTATNSDLAVWRNGSNLSGDPDLNFPTLDFAFSGTDFGTLGVTNQPDILNLETFGDKGLTNYSRVSSNNARWAIADALRVPTNADKKIHGRVSIPVGFDGTRPAWDNEAKVTVEIETTAGHKERVTASTVGHTEENPGISIYGEEAQGGVFEISLAAPLEAGTTVRIVAVELTSGELTEGALNLILVGPVEVFPIIPPTPAVVSSLTLLEESTELHGYTEDREVQISATHNGVWFNTEMADIDENGRFIIDLSSRQLKDGDEIQVFLKDSVGSAKAAGVQHPPVTNDQTGNQNPPSELSFRDAVFPAATTIKIVKSGPFPPVDPLEPEMEVEPDNPPLLPDNQGMISLDFVSQFQFGQVPIRSTKGTYYALPQQISQEGTSDTADRPNYVQITDQRKLLAETSWRLAATFDSQGFRNEDNDHLIGAQINLHNQYLATASTNADANMPELAVADDGTITLLPGEAQLLLTGGSRSTGTWIYRFGDQETAATSVELEVPAGANPKTGRYRATIEWSLSSVPE